MIESLKLRQILHGKKSERHETMPEFAATLPGAPPLSKSDLNFEPPPKPRNMRRRTFMVSSAAVGFGAAISGNRLLTELFWPPSAANVREIKADVPKSKRHSATFVFGGLGTRDSIKEATALKGALQDVGRVVSIRYNENKMDLDTVANRMNDYIAANGITEINIYGDSMGGIAGVHTLPMLDYSLNGGVRVKYIFADCTPITRSNVREQNASFPEFLGKMGFKGGGFAGKLAGQLYNNFNHPEDYFNFVHQLQTAWRVTLDPNSPALWMDQLMLVANSNIYTFAQDLATVNYEQMYYLHPRNTENDTVVYDISAIEDLRTANKQAQDYRRSHRRTVSNAQVISIPIPGTSHASCIRNQDQYTVALRGQLLSNVSQTF